jgi:hypothetical protein
MSTKYQYQPDALGVVSTDPGFVAGAYTENSYPIALIGRVPVNVSTENGVIHSGDKLTAGSIPGYAMKASIAGHTIGFALESMDESTLTDCPADGAYARGAKCGSIMVFVNLGDYLGGSVNDAMADYNAAHNITPVTTAMDGLVSLDGTMASSTATTSVGIIAGSHEDQLLTFLQSLQADRAASGTAPSDIFADKVSAVSQIIAPSIFARIVKSDAVEGLTVSAHKVVADEVDTGLLVGSNIQMQLGAHGAFTIRKNAMTASQSSQSLAAGQATSTDAFDASSTTDVLSLATSTPQSFAAGQAATSTDATSTIGVLTLSTSTTATSSDPFASLARNDGVAISFDVDGNGYFDSTLTARNAAIGGLSVVGGATFSGGLTVNTIGTAGINMDILGDTTFFGRPFFTSDTAGSAIVKKGASQVEITFDREYIDTPIVNATIALEDASSTPDLEQALFNQDVRFLVARKSVHGFTILLNKPAAEDVPFSWTAFATKNAKLFTSKDADIATSTPQVVPVSGGSDPAQTSSGAPATTTPDTVVTPHTSDATSTVSVFATSTPAVLTLTSSSTPAIIDTPAPEVATSTPVVETPVAPAPEAAATADTTPQTP